MHGTPFVSGVGPVSVEAYKIGLPREEQPPNVPETFADAMEVRKAVFVEEQTVPAEFELDGKDSRSRHWVVYASVNTIVSPAKYAEDGVTLLELQRSVTKSVPIGTLRAVPFPHPPHPIAGMRYVGDEAVGFGNDSDNDGNGNGNGGNENDNGGGKNDNGNGETISLQEASRKFPKPASLVDRKTTFHDGIEPFIQLGRLAVLSEFRGSSIGTLLVRTALDWLEKNPTIFNVSVAEVGLERLGVGTDPSKVPHWNGLVHVHAQTSAVRFWERLGFAVDHEMGSWWEEGIPHVGMFYRIKV